MWSKPKHLTKIGHVFKSAHKFHKQKSNTEIFNIVCFFFVYLKYKKIRHKDGYLDGDAKRNPKELFKLTDELK